MQRVSMLFIILMIAIFYNTMALAIEQNNYKSGYLEKTCIDAKGFTKEQVDGSELVKKFCTSCHTESRVYSTLKEMRRDSTLDYDKNVRSIVLKKLRMTSGQISRQDSKKILEYLVKL